MNNFKFFTLSITLFVVLIGCSKPDIPLVKEGTMPGYETTTIGKAFESSFDNPKWESFKGKKGERVVQFTGNISKNLHDSVIGEISQNIPDSSKMSGFYMYLDRLYGVKSQSLQNLFTKCPDLGEPLTPQCKEAIDYVLNELWKVGTPVEAQWIITPDGKSFNLTHMASAAWEGLTFEAILAVIYK